MGKIIDLASKRKSKGTTHEEKIVLYVLKGYYDLYKKGLVPKPSVSITEKGLVDIEGFFPTPNEVRMGLIYLKEEGIIPNVGTEHL